VDEELEVLSLLALIIRKWYLLLLFGLIGALLGYGLSFMNPPIYEAKAILSIGLNFDQTGSLHQYEEDLALGKVAGVVLSDDVMETAAATLTEQVAKNFGTTSLQEFRSATGLEQKGSRWELIASSQDPTLAVAMANSWAEASEHALQEAYHHALSAKNIQVELYGHQQDLQQIRTDPTDHPNSSEHIKYLEEVIQDLTEELQGELELARGLATFISFEWSQRADIPDRPSTRSRGGQILAGNLLGLTMGVIVVLMIGANKRRR
jgi:capsular polysaccharide biosynthesis protein